MLVIVFALKTKNNKFNVKQKFPISIINPTFDLLCKQHYILEQITEIDLIKTHKKI